MIFVVAVGLGPLAGILAIIMDTIDFCARFFSERIEETILKPGMALRAAGASRAAIVAGAILPECFPTFVATSHRSKKLFDLQSSLGSSAQVGAGLS